MTTSQEEAPTQRPDRSIRRAWWIVGGTVTAVVMLFSLVTAGVWIWTAASPVDSDSHTEVYPGPVSGVAVDLALGDVDLTAGNGPDLEVRRDMEWKGAEPGFEERMRGDGTFTAHATCAEGVPFWMNADDCEIGYSIVVPPGSETMVRTSTADIDADGLDGELDLVTSTGDVEAQNLRTTATSVRSSNGNVTLSFEEVLGDIYVDAGFGNVTILVPDDGTTYDVQEDMDFGEEDIDIATDPGAEADYTITVDNGFGDLEVSYLP